MKSIISRHVYMLKTSFYWRYNEIRTKIDSECIIRNQIKLRKISFNSTRTFISENFEINDKKSTNFMILRYISSPIMTDFSRQNYFRTATSDATLTQNWPLNTKYHLHMFCRLSEAIDISKQISTPTLELYQGQYQTIRIRPIRV